MSRAQNDAETPKRKNLNDDERNAVIAKLLKGSNNGILRHGDILRVAEMFGRNRRTITALWKSYCAKKDAGEVPRDLHNKRRGNCGRNGINLDSLRKALKDIPIKNRTTPSVRLLPRWESRRPLFTTTS